MVVYSRVHYNNWSMLWCTPPHSCSTLGSTLDSVWNIKRIHLETLNDFAARMEKATEEVRSASPEQPMIWPDSMMPTAGKHHCMRSEIGYGLMSQHNNNLTDQELDHKWLGPYPIKKSFHGAHIGSNYLCHSAKPTRFRSTQFYAK